MSIHDFFDSRQFNDKHFVGYLPEMLFVKELRLPENRLEWKCAYHFHQFPNRNDEKRFSEMVLRRDPPVEWKMTHNKAIMAWLRKQKEFCKRSSLDFDPVEQKGRFSEVYSELFVRLIDWKCSTFPETDSSNGRQFLDHLDSDMVVSIFVCMLRSDRIIYFDRRRRDRFLEYVMYRNKIVLDPQHFQRLFWTFFKFCPPLESEDCIERPFQRVEEFAAGDPFEWDSDEAIMSLT